MQGESTYQTFHANTSSQELIYLDNAATTPLINNVVAEMTTVIQPGTVALFGNANSLHSCGRAAFQALEAVRMRCARALGAKAPDEIIFTSGATESDNSALLGIARAARAKRHQQGKHDACQVVLSRIEHHAVLECADMLKRDGFEVVYVQNDSNGHISCESLQAVLTEHTVLVSIMYVNNETGTIQDIASLCELSHQAGALFHTDAVQALGKAPVNLKALGCDAASFSAHKVHGPKGVGVLYLKSRTPFEPYMHGGGQERTLRSGTQNLAGALGCAAAFEDAQAHLSDFDTRIRSYRDHLYEQLSAFHCVRPCVKCEALSNNFAPHIVSICVKGIDSQTLILQLDAQGICVSGGSACSSRNLKGSHVLHALGIDDEYAGGMIRISMSHMSSQNEIDRFLAVMKALLQ